MSDIQVYTKSQDDTQLATKAASSHTHAESDVTNLTTDLAAKQPGDATLTALAALDSAAGLVEQTGADTFTKRALGVGASTSVPTRGDADSRFAALSHTHAESEITGLVSDLAGKAASSHTHSAADITSGTLAVARGGTNAATANANTVFAGPTSGGAAAPAMRALVAADVPSGSTPEVCCGRLTLESGVPVSTTDQTGKTTVFWTQHKGARIALYDGSTAWATLAFAETSLALGTLTSGKNYDVFGYNNSGTLALELSAAWTNDTTRADALTTQDGVLVKSGATTRRYLGTIRTTATTTTEDSAAKRFVFNYYNRERRLMKAATETTDSWAYTTATFRQANANAANQLDYVVGDAAALIEATVSVLVNGNVGTAGVAGAAGIGVDSTSTNSAQLYGANAGTMPVQSVARYIGTPGLGRHFLAWLEYSAASGITTWFGDAGNATAYQSGIIGTIWN